MKNALLFLGLFASVFSFAQTPFTHCFGETGYTHYFRDFIRNGNSNYFVFDYGNYDGQFDADVAAYFVDLGDGLQDSMVFVEPGEQFLYSAEELGGGAVICSRVVAPDQMFSDILIQYLDIQGAETDRLLIGGDFRESPYSTATDEEQNFYLGYNFTSSPYQRSSSDGLMKISSDHEIVYDLAISSGAVLAIVPLENGEVVAVTSDLDGETDVNVTIIKFSADGELLWETELESGDGVVLITSGFYDGEKLYFPEHIYDKIITLDPDSGELLSDNAYDSGVLTTTFSPVVFYEGEMWALGAFSIYRLVLVGEEYQIAAEYPLESSFIRSEKFRSPGLWEFLDTEGKLTFFDLNDQQIGDLVDLARPVADPIREVAVNVQPDGLAFYEGVLRTGNDLAVPIVNLFDLDGNLLNSVVLENQQELNRNNKLQMRAFPGGAIAVLGEIIGPDGRELRLDLYDGFGELLSQNSLLPSPSQFIYDYRMTRLPTGKLGIYVRYEDFTGAPDVFYKINLSEPDFTPAQILDLSVGPQGITGVDIDALGLITANSVGTSTRLTVRKVDLLDGLSWETEKDFEALLRNTRNRNIAAGPTGDLLSGIILQQEDEAPLLYLDIFAGETGENTHSFVSEHTYLSASTDFLDADRIVVIGCDYNLANDGAEDRFTLTREVYSTSGDLLSEAETELPYEFIIDGLRVLNNGFVLAYGSVIRGSDTDALLLLMNEEGEIMTTSLFGIFPVWGELTIGPNPSSDLLRVQLENDHQGEITVNVYGQEGRLLGNWMTDKSSNQMTWETSLAELPAGSYWVQVKSPAGQVTAGWVKQ